MGGFQQDDLYRVNYNSITQSERENLLLSLPFGDYGLSFIRFERFERFGIVSETAVYTDDCHEFVFVPGDTVMLGWDSFAEGMNDETFKELSEALSECDVTDVIGFLKSSTSPIRQVTISPMLVEREVNTIGWREVPLDSPELEPFKNEIDKNYKWVESHGGFELNKKFRMRRFEDNLTIELFCPVSLDELIGKIHETKFSLPTEDEWEYLCGCGKRTLFRWGDSFDTNMKLCHFNCNDLNESPDSLEQPNGFGLSIAYDPYMLEVVENSEYFLKGGDGGCNICGGSGIVLGYFPVSTFFRSESLSNDSLDWQSDIGGDYTFYRKVIRL